MAKQGILEGIGSFFGGVGEHLGTGLKSVRDAERSKLAAPGLRNEASELSQLLQTYKSIDPAQTQQRDQILQRITATPTFQKFQGTIGPLAKSQTEKVSASKKIQELSKTKMALQDAGFVKEDSELSKSMGQEATRLATLLFPQQGQAVSPTIESEPLEEEKKGLSAFVGGIPGAKEVKSPVTAAGLLAEGAKPSGKRKDRIINPAVDIKAFEKFAQVSTPDFPEDNTPKPFEALGITQPADQQTMQELTKAAPEGMDVQEIVQQDPEAFKQILAALRKGKTPSGKAFTVTDALKMMGQL